MSLTLRATLLVFFVSVCANAQIRTLAVYAGPVQGLDSESTFTMRAELQRLLSPAALDVVWKNASERKNGEDFELVVVASFDGVCSAPRAALVAVNASLADTSVTNGRILPFFRVDCARITQMLGPQAEPAAIGRALARVIAHEIYHIVAHTADHHDTGVAKASFSFRDLTNPRFEFDAWSLARMRPPSMASTSEESAATGR